MTKEEAKIVILEDELVQAIHMIEFLDNCLLHPEGWKYAYPEQTERQLERLHTIVHVPAGCYHSGHEENCSACKEIRAIQDKVHKAKKVLGS